uniref:SE6L1 n=1 Tax=Macrostomum lignano TaxID=282301 RepID=A0A1I8F4T8_9PLAT
AGPTAEEHTQAALDDSRPCHREDLPQATATNQPFDVYIDQIRYMFDGITIVKLTGRFLNTGHDTEIPDILLVPNPKLSPRNLNFFAGQRVQITASDAMNLGKDSALVIRVYTLIKPDLEMVVVGTCVLPIFDNKGRLLTGGHQLRLREHASMVAAGQQRASLATSLDSIKQAKSLPCVTGLFRLLPQSARPIDAPDYTSGYYRSEECRPTDAELRVMAYVPTRMDPARCLPPNTAPRAMPQELHFHYRDLRTRRFTRPGGAAEPAVGPSQHPACAVLPACPGVAHRDGKLFEAEQEVTELKKDHFCCLGRVPAVERGVHLQWPSTGLPVFSQSDLPLTTNRVRTIRSRGLAGALKVDGALATHVIHTSVYEHLPKTTAADYQPAIDSAAQLEQSSFGQNCQEAIDNCDSQQQHRFDSTATVAANSRIPRPHPSSVPLDASFNYSIQSGQLWILDTSWRPPSGRWLPGSG